MFRITRITAVGAVLALAVTAGASLAGPPAKTSSVTLTLETPSGPGRPATNLAEAFAERVKALSDGAIVVKVRVEDPSFKAPEQKAWPYQRRHVDNVRSGRVDLATVWTQTLEYAGIGTARALHVPFLITSKAAATRATSGATASSIMAGFGRGRTRRAHPVAAGPRPALQRREAPRICRRSRRSTIRAPYAPTSPTALRALGARPIDASGGVFTAALGKGLRFGQTRSCGTSRASTSRPRRRPATWCSHRRSTPSSRTPHRGAGSRMRSRRCCGRLRWRHARRWSRAGTNVARRARSAPRAARSSTRPLPRSPASRRERRAAEEALTRDAATRAVVRAIRAQGSAEIDRIAPCAGPAAQPPAGGGAGVTTLPPSGSYRLVLKPATMRAAGADENNIRNNSGTHTLVIDGAKMGETGRNPSHSFFCAYTPQGRRPVRQSHSRPGLGMRR